MIVRKTYTANMTWRYELIDNMGNLKADLWTNEIGDYLYQSYDTNGYVTSAGQFSRLGVPAFNNGFMADTMTFAIGIDGVGMSSHLLFTDSMTAHWDSYKGQLWQGSYSN